MDQQLELKQEPVREEATESTSFPLADVKDEPTVKELVPFTKQEDSVQNKGGPQRSGACHCKELRAGNEQPTVTEGKHLHCNVCSENLLPQSVEGPPNGDSVFSCQVCDTSFPTKSKLKRHMRTHSGKRLFCNECGGTFRGETNFVKHMKVHSRGRPFQCSECELTFPTKKSMRRHKFSHSRDRTFDCN